MEGSLDELESTLMTIKRQWPELIKPDCNPLETAIPLLDNSSVGLAHKYPEFVSLKNKFSDFLAESVKQNFEAFNDSIGSYGITVETINDSQSTLNKIQTELNSASKLMSAPNEVIRELNHKQKQHGEFIEILEKIEELKTSIEVIDNLINEKNFKDCSKEIIKCFKISETYGLFQLPALNSMLNYLTNQSSLLVDSIIEEINAIVYLKFNSSDKSTYDEQTKSNLFNMSTTDIDDVSKAINKPLEQFLKELRTEGTNEDGFSPGNDIQSFYLLRNQLKILNDLSQLDGVLNTLIDRSYQEIKTMIDRSVEEIRLRYPEQVELATTSTNSNNTSNTKSNSTTSSNDYMFNTNSLSGINEIIMKDFFSNLFRKCTYLLQSHRAIFEISNQYNSSYDFNSILNNLEKQLSSLLYSYIVDEKLLENLEQNGNNKNLINSPFIKLPKNYIANDDHEPIFQFSKLSFKGKVNKRVQNVIEDMFPGQSSKFLNNYRITHTNNPTETLFIETEANKNDLLVAPNVFNMSVIIDYLLFFTGSSILIIPNSKDKMLKFFDHFMNIVFLTQLENTLVNKFDNLLKSNVNEFNENNSKFKRFFKSCFEILNTSLNYRKPYVNILLKILNNLIVKYQNQFNESISIEYLKSNKHVPIWLSNERLNQISRRILLNDKDEDLVLQENSLILNSTTIRSFNLIEKSDLLDSHRFNLLTKLLLSLLNTLNWLPNSKRSVSSESLDQNNINQLKEMWAIKNPYFEESSMVNGLNNNGVDNSITTTTTSTATTSTNNELFFDSYLALEGESLVVFEKLVKQLTELSIKIKLILRYDLKLKSIWYIISTLNKESWLLNYESEEIEADIMELSKSIILSNRLLSDSMNNSNFNKFEMLVGLPNLIDSLFVSQSTRIIKMNENGCLKLFLNIRIVQQMLRNVFTNNLNSIEFKKSINYFNLFKSTEKGILEKIKSENKNLFTLEEYKNIVRIIFSESLSKELNRRQSQLGRNSTGVNGNTNNNGRGNKSVSSYTVSKRYGDVVKKLEMEFKN